MSETALYKPLVDALKAPLPERIDDREKLRQMVAFAESYGVIISEHRRKLLVVVENTKAEAILRLQKGMVYNDEGELVHDEEFAASYQKMNADQKEILLNSETSELTAELDFVTNLENLIKRRCSLGQTISNSFNTETQSAYNT